MENAFQMSAQKLAFLGDAVYELLIREKIVKEYNKKIGDLHKLKVEKVCCDGQSDSLKKIIDYLTPEELSIFKRGKNIRTGRIPKNSTAKKYHCATGFEALFGYLYLTDNMYRNYELLEMMNI